MFCMDPVQCSLAGGHLPEGGELVAQCWGAGPSRAPGGSALGCSGWLWGTWLPGLGGRALAAAVPAVPPGASAAAPVGRPRPAQSPADGRGRGRGVLVWEGPGPWSLGREGTAETGGLGQGHGGGGRAGRCWRPGLTPVLSPGYALHLEEFLSPRGCECVAAGRPCLGGPSAGRPEGVCAGPALRQLCQRL